MDIVFNDLMFLDPIFTHPLVLICGRRQRMRSLRRWFVLILARYREISTQGGRHVFHTHFHSSG